MSAKQQAGTGVKLKEFCPECESLAILKTTLILDFSGGHKKQTWRRCCDNCINKEAE